MLVFKFSLLIPSLYTRHFFAKLFEYEYCKHLRDMKHPLEWIFTLFFYKICGIVLSLVSNFLTVLVFAFFQTISNKSELLKEGNLKHFSIEY